MINIEKWLSLLKSALSNTSLITKWNRKLEAIVLMICVEFKTFNFIFYYLAGAHGNTHGYVGTFKILSGTSFTPALQNSSTPDFKVLAFDVEQLVSTCGSLVNSRVFGIYINSLTWPALTAFSSLQNMLFHILRTHYIPYLGKSVTHQRKSLLL